MTRIVIVAPAWIGDMVMTESLVAALKRRDPSAEIDLIAPAWTAPLGSRMAGVRRTIPTDAKHGRFDFMKRVRLGRRLRGEKYDLGIVLPRSLKSALPPFFARAKRRRGYRGEMRFILLNDMRHLDEMKLPRTIDRFVALANDDRNAPPVVAPPVLRQDPAATKRLAETLGVADERRPVVAICPGAEFGPAKQWPAAHFATLAGLLAKKGYAVWILGSPKDQAVAEQIRSLAATRDKAAAPVNLCGRTDLVQAIDLMSLVDGVVTNDSGLMHIAAAVNRPLVALYGSTTPAMTPPLGRNVRILEKTLPCRPCFQRVCPLGHLDCLNTISAAEVAAALDELMPQKASRQPSVQ
jgi:heptosyltransferase-2